MKTRVFNVIVLDKSGSMSSIARQAVDGVCRIDHEHRNRRTDYIPACLGISGVTHKAE